jgi:uncharacterized protein involved in exopolysaccharide biosynthesis
MVDEKRVTTRPSEPEDAVRLEFMDPQGQRVWALYANDGSGSQPSASGFSVSLADLPGILRRQKRLLMLCVLAMSAIGGAYMLLATQIFGAGAEVLVERRDSALGEFSRVTTANNAFLATQAEVVHSQAIVEPALKLLPFTLTDDPEADPVRFALETLSVTPVHGTDVLAIHYRGEDADKGVALIGAMLDQYRGFVRGVEASGHGEGLTLLRDREEKLRTELAELEQQYRDSVSRSGALGAERGAGEVDHDVLSVHAQRAVDAENRRRDLETELSALKRALANDAFFAPGPLADPHLVGMLSTANSELALLRVSSGAGHPDALDAQRRIRVLKQQIVQQIESALARARADERRLKGVYAAGRDASRSLDVERSSQETLQADIARLSAAHDAALEALAEKEMTVGALERSGVQVRVIKAPRASSERLWPRAELVMLPCIVLGLLGGSVLAIAVDRARPLPKQQMAQPRAQRTAPPPFSTGASLGRALVTREEKDEPKLIEES